MENSKYDQEIPQSQTADKPMAWQGRATQQSRDTRPKALKWRQTMNGTYCPNMNGWLDTCISQKSRIALFKGVLNFDPGSGCECQPSRVAVVQL